MEPKDFCCVSVVGGWQTGLKNSNITFGPVFRNTNELWAWQKDNLYKQI